LKWEAKRVDFKMQHLGECFLTSRRIFFVDYPPNDQPARLRIACYRARLDCEATDLGILIYLAFEDGQKRTPDQEAERLSKLLKAQYVS
jgi:hypothetical protein